MASPANISNIIEPTAAKAKSVTAAGRLSAGPSWRVAAAIFAPNVRAARVVFWPWPLLKQNHGANPPLLVARKTSNHLEIGEKGQPAVDFGRNNWLWQTLERKNLLRSADEFTSINRFCLCAAVGHGSPSCHRQPRRRYQRLRGR